MTKDKWWDIFLTKEVSPGGVMMKSFLIKNTLRVRTFKTCKPKKRPRWVEQSSTPPKFFRHYLLDKKVGIIVFGVEILMYYKCKDKPERTELLDVMICY